MKLTKNRIKKIDEIVSETKGSVGATWIQTNGSGLLNKYFFVQFTIYLLESVASATPADLLLAIIDAILISYTLSFVVLTM